MKETDALYEQFDTDCRSELKALYSARYMQVWNWLKGELPDDDEVDELVEMYLAGLWDEPNESTHYAFGPELERKRDRAKEAIIAVPTQTQKQLELEKASRYVIQQSGFYVDITSQDAEKQAMVNAGVKKVKWNIYGDDRVCKTCHDRNGKIYEIGKVPPRPHLRCRCYLTPVID
jgi:SPP1 gp7 family putative phage head morphogenesis protein